MRAQNNIYYIIRSVLFHDDDQLFGRLKHVLQFDYSRRRRTQRQQGYFVVDVGTAVLAESRAVRKLGREHFSRRDRSASSDRGELTPVNTQKRVRNEYIYIINTHIIR